MTSEIDRLRRSVRVYERAVQRAHEGRNRLEVDQDRAERMVGRKATAIEGRLYLEGYKAAIRDLDKAFLLAGDEIDEEDEREAARRERALADRELRRGPGDQRTPRLRRPLG